MRSQLLYCSQIWRPYVLELRDVMFCVQSLKSPTRDFDIMNFVSFSSGDTRSSAAGKMRHASCNTNSVKHFYFHRLPRLWNLLPQVDLGSSVKSIKSCLQAFLFAHFRKNNSCTTHFMCPCSKCGNVAHPPNYK